MIYPIKIKSAKDVTHISELIAQSGENITITYQNITIDPRSVLGLFTMVGKNATLVGPDHMSPEKFSRLLKKLGCAV